MIIIQVHVAPILYTPPRHINSRSIKIAYTRLHQNDQHSIRKWALMRYFTNKKITSASYVADKWAVDCTFRLTSFEMTITSHINTTERLQHFDVINT